MCCCSAAQLLIARSPVASHEVPEAACTRRRTTRPAARRRRALATSPRREVPLRSEALSRLPPHAAAAEALEGPQRRQLTHRTRRSVDFALHALEGWRAETKPGAAEEGGDVLCGLLARPDVVIRALLLVESLHVGDEPVVQQRVTSGRKSVGGLLERRDVADVVEHIVPEDAERAAGGVGLGLFLLAGKPLESPAGAARSWLRCGPSGW
eukprot:CAMPEP_0195655358 /NCGR_PEP_ID=MMETSP0815-20121206/34417_1 /TAXON_ID=97485 /ORGANISM="Prymnesium parvum, Strain Texoma1" /LENGTH=209 /DNA_ID=CAMNT_0040799643 /DNA_START=431 /DNA_END=1058 /DNA_ORIENTATION=+